MATFIFAIGGTGSRVLRSFTNFLIGCEDLGKIIPIIIDIDQSNKSVDLCQQSIKKYYDFRNSYGTELICKTEINSSVISNPNPYDFYDIITDANITFGQYIGYEAFISNPTINNLDRDFVESIFDIESELKLNIVNGFVGHPNIGSFVFDELDENKSFSILLTQIAANPANKIIIINSLFGGTGASGLPHIIKLIENASTKFPNLKNIPVAAISYFPYYLTGNKQDAKIKANTWLSKSKAAANYYMDNITRVNCIYPVYDTPIHTQEYSEGGQNQNNAPHWAELIGAFCIKDFITSQFDLETKMCKYFKTEQEISNSMILSSNEIQVNSFNKAQYTDFIKPILRTSLIYKISYISANIDIDYDYSIALKNKTSEFYKPDRGPIINYLSNGGNDKSDFISYLTSIQTTERGIKLINLDSLNLENYINKNLQHYQRSLNEHLNKSNNYNNFLNSYISETI